MDPLWHRFPLRSETNTSFLRPVRMCVVACVQLFAGWLCLNKLHQYRHCLHMINLNSDLDYFPNFRCKLSVGVMSTWLVTNDWKHWDVAMIYTGGTRIRVTVQWITLDHMALSPTKSILTWAAGVNSQLMNGRIPNTKPKYYQCTFAALLCN